jgi:hypothetical protein
LRNRIKYLVTLIIITISISACATYSPAPYNTVKVLAVTAEGDTIQLDVNSLRPRVYQNIYYFLITMDGIVKYGIIINLK